MDNMKRFVSVLLCLVMLLGILPVSAFAVDTANSGVVDAALFFSDLHTSQKDYKEDEILAVMGGVKTSGLDFSSVTSVGDAFSSNDYVNKGRTTAAITGAIRTGLGDSDVIVNYVWSDHDRGTDVENFTGLMHSGENYYIYAISMSDMSSSTRYGQPSTFSEDKLTAFTNTVAGLDHTKPMFIVSHLPLHDRRNDNQYADEWYEVISAAAEQMDVVFLWGHNHTFETSVDAAAYYVAKDSSEKLTIQDVGSVVPNFTYLNAGYMSPSSTGYTSDSVRQEVVVAAAIYGDSITFTTYDKDGVCTGSDAMAETVVREFAASEPEVPETTAPAETEPKAEPVVDAATGITVAAPGVTNVTVEALEPEYNTEVYTAYASFDIVLEGYAQGTEATVCVPAPASFDANRPVLVLYAGKVIATTKIVGGKVTFTTDHFSTYDLAQTAEEELDWVCVSEAQNKTIFRLTDALTSGKYVIVSRNTAGSGNAVNLSGNNINSVGVTVIADANGNYIEAPATTAQWSYSSNIFANVNTANRYLRGNSSGNMRTTAKSSDSYTTWSSNANGLYTTRDYTNYYINSSFTMTTRGSSSNRVYIYAEDTLKIEETWAAMSGDADYTYYVGEFDSNEALLDALKEHIRVYTATDENGTNAAEDLSYTISSNVNCAAVGTYTLTVSTAERYKVGEITVNILAEPYLQITENDRVVTAPIMRKNVKVGDTIQLGVQAFDGSSVVDEPANVTWRIVEGYEDMAEVSENGLVTCLKAHGIIWVEAEWVLVEGDTTVTMTDMVLISVTDDNFFTPADGTNDFPEFPDKGSIRFDKTAEGVGNFSNTGIAKVELSMTGVPFATPETLDVVLMLDRSSSMYKSGVQHRISSTIAATKTFIENIVMNDDGTFNNNRIMVMDFLGGNLDSSEGGGSSHQYKSNLYTTNEESGYQIIGSQEELDDLFDTIDRGFKGQTSLYGTEYARGLEDCYNALAASRADGNKQFCVFMSDGIPNYMMGETTHFKKTDDIVARFNVTNRTAANGTATRGINYEYEYYSTQMKNEGVTVYTVGLGLLNTNSAWSGTSKEVCEQVANMLLNDISGPAGETAAQRDTGNAVSKLDQYFFSVADDNAAENMKDVFDNIASSISEAASNVVVTDKIDPQYNVIFDVPKGTREITGLPEGQQFYIEVVDYPLNEYHDRITASAKSVFKLCLKDSNGAAAGGTYSAVDGEGNAYAAPVFRAAAEGQKAYWSIVERSYEVQPNDIVIEIDGICYKFMELGDGTHNVASGAYAYGSINEDNMSTDLVLITPYFAYSAETRMLAWTAEKLSADRELALSYFVYLIDSATEVGVDGVEVAPGPYPTNDWAYITYTNFNGNDCRQEFPVPQLTWNGAQVSYVFYLVNEKGEPINKSGQVVDFANAVFVTDVFTEHVIWNKEGTEGASELNIQYLAKDKLSEAYTLYDENAEYAVHVFQEEDGTNKFNYFIIDGSAEGTVMGDHSVLSDDTTKVYNTKAGERYTEYGTYSDKPVGTTFNTLDAGGNRINITTTHQANLDYADTTVAFAVLWMPRLAPDVVVVDYGLDVLINVVMNDSLQNTISGISQYVSGTAVQDTGVYVTAKMGMENLNIDGNTISIENENQVRFHQGDMEFDQEVKFYYESPVSFTENGNTRTGYMYSSVTVIPATTIYYEDGFVDYSSYTWVNGWQPRESLWHLTDPELSNTQAQDRPGDSQISGSIDADNIYGYDGAYTTMNGYSNGSAMMATVDYDNYAQAQFEFYGTGFDVISLTSNTTGTILVDVKNLDTNQMAGNFVVDTYYGYDLVEYGCYTYTLKGYRTCQYTYSNGAWTAKFVGGVLSEPFVSQTQPVNPAEGATYKVCEEFWQISADYEKVDALLEDEPRPVGDKAVPGATYKVYRGIFQIAPNNPNALYQIPVMKIEDLPYGRYQVTIKATYDKSFDHVAPSNETGSYDFYLDAIRIYDPANNGKDSSVIGGAYEKDHEAYPHYFELRNAIITANDFDNLDSDLVSGIVYIDGYDEKTPAIRDYLKYGPNNELYLSNDQAVAFAFNQEAILEAIADEDTNAVPDGFVIDRVHIGLKLVTGTTATAQMYDAGAANGKTFSQKLTTATDMYYDITDLVNGSALVIKNTSADGILSITDIKVTYKAADSAAQAASAEPALMTMSAGEAAEESIFLVSRDIGQMALASMMAVQEPEVPTEPEEPTEPEIFTPGLLTMKVNKTNARVGQKVQVTITTSADVRYLTINGQKLTAYKNIHGGYTRSWTVTLTAKEAGEMEIAVVAYNSKDVASEAVTTTVKVTAKNWINGKF